MIIHLIGSKATADQIVDMMEALSTFIKVAVDVEHGILAGGGALHYDCEEVLLANGSLQENVWGANWFPSLHEITCEAVMNIRPNMNNPSMMILDNKLCQRVVQIARRLLEAD